MTKYVCRPTIWCSGFGEGSSECSKPVPLRIFPIWGKTQIGHCSCIFSLWKIPVIAPTLPVNLIRVSKNCNSVVTPPISQITSEKRCDLHLVYFPSAKLVRALTNLVLIPEQIVIITHFGFSPHLHLRREIMANHISGHLRNSQILRLLWPVVEMVFFRKFYKHIKKRQNAECNNH